MVNSYISCIFGKLLGRDPSPSVMIFFSSRRRHTMSDRDWSADVCSSDLLVQLRLAFLAVHPDLTLAALDVAEAHHAVDLGDRGRVLGPPGFEQLGHARQAAGDVARLVRDRKSTRLNSSHDQISYAVFCLK